ncbi:expressed unknown protein [Seminavis robusta]|uniref:Uncharacterized protein n=1 Tax=Seminavis robusta TaxID=568900 RepID=A0A9N8HDU8_9STRA|nr:expressed unknown protein [Seminavis robusta]|eukprot:Sro358_g125870.1 n/a (378) ;mRNA; r:31530-32952
MNQDDDGGGTTRQNGKQQSTSANQDTQHEIEKMSKVPSTETTVRNAVGQGMNAFSDAINNNLVAARYGTVATVTLLAAYGLSNTPLFFRYKSVADIPARLFVGRKRLRARLIRTEENDQAGQPIICYVRHLSPVGRVLNREMYEFGTRAAPSAQVTGNPEGDLIKVEIAGLSAPPFYASTDYQRGEWLQRLASDKTKVTLQLLGRRVPNSPSTGTGNAHNNTMEPNHRNKRDVTVILPELEQSLQKDNLQQGAEEQQEQQIAVGRLYYRPSLFQLFATDLATPLVRYGHATAESEMFMKSLHTEGTKIVDATQGLDTIRKDVKYLDRLGKLEYEAAKGSYGMWSDTLIREKRRDIVDEVEFQTNATAWQKLWRWIRG